MNDTQTNNEMTIQDLKRNAALNQFETIEDLKFQRESIIETIEAEEMGLEMKRVMNQIVSIVTASNYIAMDIDANETIYRAIDDVNGMLKAPKVIDNGQMHRESAMNNLPSSMR